MDLALRIMTDRNEKLQESLTLKERELNGLKLDKDRESELLSKRIAELERAALDKQVKDASFSISSLIKDTGLQIETSRKNALCRRVVSLFSTQFPDSKPVKRHRVAFFKPKDRHDVKHILHQVHLQMELEADEKEHVLIGN